MIAVLRPLKKTNDDQGQNEKFLAMLPSMRAQARFAFRNCGPQERLDAVQEVILLAFDMFVSLVRRGRESLAYPTPLVQYAIRQYRIGRRLGTTVSINDVTSPVCRYERGVQVQSLDKYNTATDAWREVLVEDRKVGPADTAAARLDTSAWLRSLPQRDRKVAKVLAAGETTNAAAKKFRISAGRISQLRRELEESWEKFQGELVAA